MSGPEVLDIARDAILTLVLVSSGLIERLLSVLPRPLQKWTRNFLRSDPPAALGTRFDPESK